MMRFSTLIVVALLALGPSEGRAQDYIGQDTCLGCLAYFNFDLKQGKRLPASKVGVGRAKSPALFVLPRRGPRHRLCTPEEVAEAVGWLCSPQASYINGAALPMDGGT